MPTEVYEDSLSIDIELLEAISAEVGNELFRSSFPFPTLIKTGRVERFELPIFVVENALLKVVVAPTLGGRILQIFDRRGDRQIFGPSDQLTLESGGPRGVFCRDGLRWSALSRRLNDLGPVEFQQVEPDSEDSPGGIWLAELVSGAPISVHVGISLAPNRAEIRLEMRTFNRQFDFEEVAPHFSVAPPPEAKRLECEDGIGYYDEAADAGLIFAVDRDVVRLTSIQPEMAVGHFPENSGRISPRQLDTWSFSVFPLSGLGGLTAFSKEVALYLGPQAIRVTSLGAVEESQSSVSQPNAASLPKIVLVTPSGETFEAPAHLSPLASVNLPLGTGMPPPKAIAVIAPDRRELLRWPAAAVRRPSVTEIPIGHGHPAEPAFSRAAADLFEGQERRDELQILGTYLGFRSAALSLLAISEMREGHFPEAIELLQDGLLYNAEDHLGWWLQGVAARLAEQDAGERAELLNAHYLARLEPALRAESFLTQNAERESPSLLAPLANNPEALVEVACLLSQCRLYPDLSRWARACLAQRETPMLRYLLAAALLEGSKMRTEAAHEVLLAGKAPLTPPYPWRQEERRVLEQLAKEFPGDARIGELLAMLAR